MEYKRPVRGNCWVITIICCLHFNFEYYFFNNKGAGIVSEPGERRELGLPAVAAPCVLAARVDQRGWHISRSRHPEEDFCPLMSKDRTQQKRKAVARVVKPGRSVIRAQGSRFCSRWMQWYGNYPFQRGDLGAGGRQPGPAERGHCTRAELVGGPDSLQVRYPHLVW